MLEAPWGSDGGGALLLPRCQVIIVAATPDTAALVAKLEGTSQEEVGEVLSRTGGVTYMPSSMGASTQQVPAALVSNLGEARVPAVPHRAALLWVHRGTLVLQNHIHNPLTLGVLALECLYLSIHTLIHVTG